MRFSERMAGPSLFSARSRKQKSGRDPAGPSEARATTPSIVGVPAKYTATSFYERHGFRKVRETDGSACEEKLPDALYEWRRQTL
ncbi:hypothetical protein AGR4B_Cc100229 [Agrobacterium tumefaciens str. CFBP 5621]|nr:hypothetical protein AGR4B_Cc100229 [Agrobacterium tumefaciens str. CFBP 5621]